jgi:hypothetical protein
MTDFIADSPLIARPYCPGCEPDADPTREILDVRWCESHAPVREGADDAVVRADGFLSGGIEAGGDANRRWCELIHASSRRRRRRRRRLGAAGQAPAPGACPADPAPPPSA